MEIKYQLTPQNLATYQATIRPRLTAQRKGWLASSAFKAAIFAGVSLLLFLASDWLIEWLTGSFFDAISLIYGLVLGIVLVLAGLWIDYFEMRGAMLKPNGLMFSPHVLRTEENGFSFSAPLYEARYRWPAFDEITVVKDLFVLWIEPGLGFVIPQAAFASPSEANAFFEMTRAKIAAAKAA